ncbi:GlsB/YeaQ/YmgE family stress response membrane protein [Kineosporiaceae bacterium SCSIO 59966]|nr:GlsB/YeaQ/YmgE family stress response membrane protein [Kineosporiaceae bacterium SCSIO 59966]
MELIGLIIFGGVIGALARLVMPGDQNLGILWTIILGVLGALVGYWLGGVLGVEDTPGIDWIRWIISTVAAVLFISIYIGVRGRRRV